MKFKNLSLMFRPILKYKEYSLLNILGLAIGMASAMIIFLWADRQMSMDKFHENGKNIYLLHKQMKFSDGQSAIDMAITAPLGPAISSEIPEIKAAVRIPWDNRFLFRIGEKSFFEEGIYADSTFFRVFSFPLLHG
ncbi:MAG TPA: ABC transporter permease, partial [Bacteroidales bacterium]